MQLADPVKTPAKLSAKSWVKLQAKGADKDPVEKRAGLSLRGVAKSAVKSITPPIVWNAARWARFQVFPRPTIPPLEDAEKPPENKVRIVSTSEDLDREIAYCDQARTISDDAFRAALDGFNFEPDFPLPEDPESPEYHEAQMRLYRMVARRERYDAQTDETTNFDLDPHVEMPFPYCTKSSITVGQQLMAIGHLISTLDLRVGDRILEFGMGWGKTTIEFAQMGFDITGVDINEKFIELNRRRCERLGVKVSLVHSDMLQFESARPFDRVVFYECFHHCLNPQQMIRNLDRLVAPGGAIVFSGEPIWKDCPFPWGIRLQGHAAYAIRKYGWFELGFQTDYFTDLLERNGWTAEMHKSNDVSWQSTIVARRTSA